MEPQIELWADLYQAQWLELLRVSADTQATTSSIPSGVPSSVWQMRTTAGRSLSLNSKLALALRAL